MKNRTLMLIFVAMLCLFGMSPYADAEQPGKGGMTMHTYLVLFGFTAQGIEHVKESPARVDAAKETVRTMGGKVKAFYGILGSEFDTIFIIEAPDDEAVAKMVLSIASAGNVRTETHRLFTEDEYKNIISALP